MMRMTMAAVALTLAFAPTGRAQDVPPEGEKVTRIAEQVEIMRVVLTKELNRGGRPLAEMVRRKGEAGVTASPSGLGELFTTDVALSNEMGLLMGRSMAGQRTSHTRGFYAPGIGAWFSTELKVPFERVEKIEADEDLWEQARKQVHSGESEEKVSKFAGRRTVYQLRLQQAAIDAAVETVLSTLKRYGQKLEDLPAHESIVVALQFVPGASADMGVAGTLLSSEDLFVGGGSSVRLKTVVISINKGEVVDVVEELDSFSKRARITRY